MEVLSSVAVALNDRRHIHLGELGLEVLQGEDGLGESLAGDGEAVLFRVNVWHSAVVPHEVFAGRSDEGVPESRQPSLSVVRIPGVGQQAGVRLGVVLVDGAVEHRVLRDDLHVGWAHLADLVVGHVIHDVASVVLGVNPPEHLQVVASSHLESAHSSWVSSEVRHIVQTTLK